MSVPIFLPSWKWLQGNLLKAWGLLVAALVLSGGLTWLLGSLVFALASAYPAAVIYDFPARALPWAAWLGLFQFLSFCLLAGSLLAQQYHRCPLRQLPLFSLAGLALGTSTALTILLYPLMGFLWPPSWPGLALAGLVILLLPGLLAWLSGAVPLIALEHQAPWQALPEALRRVRRDTAAPFKRLYLGNLGLILILPTSVGLLTPLGPWFFPLALLWFLFLCPLILAAGILPAPLPALPAGRYPAWGLIIPGLAASAAISFFTARSNAQQLQTLRRQLQTQIQFAQQQRFPKGILPGSAYLGNAADTYLQLISREATFALQAPDDIQQIEEHLTGQISAHAAVTEKYRVTLALLEKGIHQAYVQFPLPFFYGTDPDFLAASHLARLMASRALGHCENGQPAEGVRQLFAVVAFGKDLSRGDWSHYGTMSTIVGNIGLRPLGECLAAGRLPPPQLRSVLRQLERGRWSAWDLRNLLNNHRLLEENALIGILGSSQVFRSFTEETGWPEKQVNKIAQHLLRPFVIDAARKTETLWQALFTGLEQPDRRMDEISAHLSAAHARLFRENYLIGPASASPFNQILDMIQRVQVHHALLNGLYTQSALELHFAAHQGYPARLQDLVPAIIPSLPPDPFVPGPLRYQRQGTRYRLYSVGANRRDDGGRDGHFNRARNLASQPDIVFR